MTQVHLYRNNGFNLILDVPSGVVHMADDLLFDVVGRMDRGETRTFIKDQLTGAASGKRVSEEELDEVFLPDFV